ncbi:endothelial zinc finger protein induced by tumor necrosis factor alpha [Agrilus planipennis]|uniref:Endothelial zinc finger protein induced by tumor necrosis factor alpha n=1 Tax=Agrilus planipennis TaxID=224129 RepID=A0A1W4XM08_AGRPL|nr:endothelial zinc finger protein induced by tumor necrosis factor alpha [Agrilus planipennis]
MLNRMSVTFTVRENPHCLVCSSRVGYSTRNSVQIFNKDSLTCRERPLKDVISYILNMDIKEDTVHSLLICKKCFKLIDELEELEQRLADIKSDLIDNYKKSLQETKCEVDISNKKENESVHLPKTILDIPSSDDDTQGTVGKMDTLTDIEMELEKIHGEDSSVKMQNVTSQQKNFHNYQNINIVNSGTINNSESNLEASESSKNLIIISNEKVLERKAGSAQIKVEPDTEEASEKPLILKKRDAEKIKKIKEEAPVSVVSREGDLYTCLLCDGEQTVCGAAKAIIQHVRSTHDSRLYICDVCGQDFRKRNELSLHLDEHVATEEGDFQCEICNRIFSNLRLFRIHRRMHYPQNKAWTCDICGKRYSSKNLLEEHINTHTGNRPYICSLCGKDFASKYTFKAHEKTHEVRPRPFQCQQCNKSFLSQQNLTQHERTHSGVKEFACHICGKQFGSAHNLEVHSIVHTGYKPFICGLCGKAFARKAEIRDHERTHTGERPYQCEFCGATFSQRSNLQSHKRATHYDDKRYKCQECGKGFKRRRLLDYHTKAAHTGERPFKCNVCGATFVYPEHFKKHRRIHTGEKPFLCEVCGKAFNSRDNRNAHRFVHSDKKPYECLVCGAGFMRKPLLYQHMQSQGHLNDTIVVNQPRLTTDDDQIITVNADGEMEIVDGEHISSLQALEGIEEEGNEDTKLFITEHVLIEGGDVFGNSKGTLVVSDQVDEDNMEESETVGHIIINGQQIQFTNDGDEEETGDGEDNSDSHQVLGPEEYQEITEDMFSSSRSQIIQTSSGPVQLVKVRIPNESGEEEEAWIKIVN